MATRFGYSSTFFCVIPSGTGTPCRQPATNSSLRPPALRRSRKAELHQVANSFRERQLVRLLGGPGLDGLPFRRRHAKGNERVPSGRRTSASTLFLYNQY